MNETNLKDATVEELRAEIRRAEYEESTSRPGSPVQKFCQDYLNKLCEELGRRGEN